jgi:hypothetical protein
VAVFGSFGGQPALQRFGGLENQLRNPVDFVTFLQCGGRQKSPAQRPFVSAAANNRFAPFVMVVPSASGTTATGGKAADTCPLLRRD